MKATPSRNFFMKIVIYDTQKKMFDLNTFEKSVFSFFFFLLHGQMFEILNCLAAYGNMFYQEVIFCSFNQF